MSSCTAIIPYTRPIAPEEFIRREAERTRANTVIAEQPVSPVRQPALPKSNLDMDTITRVAGCAISTVLAGEKSSSRMTTLELLSLLFKPSTRIASPAKLDGDKIAEALQSELAITIAGDARPIVATYACVSCVAVGGYDPTNKIAFVVHFATADEVRKCGGLVFYNISKLAKTPISSPIQLHLRGGEQGSSEATVEAIKLWMGLRRQEFPMEIASEDILTSGMDKSLLIDSRTGEVSEYNPMLNDKRRSFSSLDFYRMMSSAYIPNITLAYSPK